MEPNNLRASPKFVRAGMEMEWAATSPPQPSLKQKIRSISIFSCCFRSAKSGDQETAGPAAAASLIRSSSTWIRSKASEFPDLKVRYRAMMARMGRSSRRGYGDQFRYDPLSYALNFDERAAGDDSALDPNEEFRYRNFSSRLPASPPQPSSGVSCR